MSIKWSAKGLTVNEPQPSEADDVGVFSCAGDKKISIYHEPGSLSTTGYTLTPGYIVGGRWVFETARERLLYANCATVTRTMAPLEGATLAEYQAAQGDWTEFAIPAGALWAYIHITAASGGTINLLVGSR